MSQVFTDKNTFGLWRGSSQHHPVFGGEEDSVEMVVRTAVNIGDLGYFQVGHWAIILCYI